MARSGSRLWRLAKALVAAVVVFAAILGGAVAFGVLEAPQVAGVESQFAGVNASTTLVDSSIAVSNPNPVSVSLGDATLDHTLRMNGIEMGSGTTQGIDLPRGRSTTAVTTAIANRNISAWWASHVRNGERTTVTTTARLRTGVPLAGPVEVSESESFETDLLSRFNSTESRQVSTGVSVLPDPLLVVERTTAGWDRVNRTRTAIDIGIDVRNPTDLSIPVSRLDYNVSMNDVTVANGTTDPAVIEPGTRTTIETTVPLRNDRLDEWWVSHLERDQTTTIEVGFTAVVEVPTGGTIRIPLDALTYSEEFSTAIFEANTTG